MATEKASFWQRMGSWLSGQRIGGTDTGLPPVGDDGLLMRPKEEEAKDDRAAGDSGFLKRRSADRSVAVFEEGFGNLVSLMTTINSHLQEQIRRHDRISDSLRTVPQVLDTMAASSKTQTELMQAISEHLAGQKYQSQQMTEALRVIPQLSKAQTDMMSNIGKQLEVQADTDVQMSQTLSNFNTTLERINRSAEAQLMWMEEARQKETRSTAELRELLSHQTRRFVLLTAAIIAFVLVLVLAGGGLAFLWWSRP